MSEKTYTPFEVAIKVLDKVKELVKAETCSVEKADEMEKARILDFKTGAHLGGKEATQTTPPTGKLSMAPSAEAPKAAKPKKEKKVPNSLEEFMANKKAKKTKQMEKALGMQGATPPVGAPGSSPLAPKKPKLAVPAMGTPNKKV